MKTAFWTQFHGISLPFSQNSAVRALPFKLRGELLLEAFLLFSRLFGLDTEKHKTSIEQTDLKFLRFSKRLGYSLPSENRSYATKSL